MKLFAGFSEMLVVVSLGIPLLFFAGKQLRRWTGGKVQIKEPRKSAVTPSNSVAKKRARAVRT